MTPEELVQKKAEVYNLWKRKEKLVADFNKLIVPHNELIKKMNEDLNRLNREILQEEDLLVIGGKQVLVG